MTTSSRDPTFAHLMSLVVPNATRIEFVSLLLEHLTLLLHRFVALQESRQVSWLLTANSLQAASPACPYAICMRSG
jgi:hypothetical protein